MGLTTQRETTVLWDKETGETICNAIAWPDTRTSDVVRELKQRAGAEKLQDLCGLPLSTYPSSVKVAWLLRNNEAVRRCYDSKRLMFGTIDTWLLYKLNGGSKRDLHVTDVTNASRTMYLNLHTLKYDSSVLEFFGLDTDKIHLPLVKACSDADAFGSILSGPLAGTKITGSLGDQSAALVGQLGFSPGQAKNTYGTGCFLLYNVGDNPVISKHGLLATVAYDFGGHHKPMYALEGSIAVAGSAIKFLQNNLDFIDASHKINDLAESVPDNGGCVFVTAFSGLFAPYWIDDARGSIFGLTQHTQKGHIARATMEATCFQTRAILEAMEKDSGRSLTQLAVDGGMSNSDLCMQVSSRRQHHTRASGLIFTDSSGHHWDSSGSPGDERDHCSGCGYCGGVRSWCMEGLRRTQQDQQTRSDKLPTGDPKEEQRYDVQQVATCCRNVERMVGYREC